MVPGRASVPDVTVEDAQRCTELFRETLSDESFAKYRRFLGGFLHCRIDLQAFLTGVTDLIKGHDDLLLEFNKFLPRMDALAAHQKPSEDDSLRIRGDEDPRKDREVSARKNENDDDNDSVPQTEMEFRGPRKKKIWEVKSDKTRRAECKKFLSRVKLLVENDQTYRDFLKLMKHYQEHKDIDRLDKQVLQLFRDQPELHVEFTVFLVDAIEAREAEKELQSLEERMKMLKARM